MNFCIEIGVEINFLIVRSRTQPPPLKIKWLLPYLLMKCRTLNKYFIIFSGDTGTGTGGPTGNIQGQDDQDQEIVSITYKDGRCLSNISVATDIYEVIMRGDEGTSALSLCFTAYVKCVF